jgi:beta-mannosidase
MFRPVLLSCEEHGEIDQKPNPNTQPKPVEISGILHVANETENAADGIVNWELRRPDSSIVKSGSESVHVEPYSGTWLDKLDFSDEDPLEVHLTYELIIDGKRISNGTSLFCAPKHYHFLNPDLKVQVNGNEITVTADAFCKGVCVSTDDGNLQLSDNYFDMENGTETLQITDNAVWTENRMADLSSLKVWSVYDIADCH